VQCALELLAAIFDQPEGNTYEALVLTGGDPATGSPAPGIDPHPDALPADGPVAYACFGLAPMTDATYDLYWMITRADLRGRGLGSRLMAGLEDALVARGARTLRIETSSLEGQGGARRFYERCGYEVSGLIRDFYRPGDDLVTLTKRLSGRT
jgi:GNAT superfamily N-acetyltransferase